MKITTTKIFKLILFMLIFLRYYINITYKMKTKCVANVSYKPSGLTAKGVDDAEGGSTADGMMDQVFLGFTLKTWIMIFLVLIIIGHSQNKMPWNTPVKPTQYYW